MTELERGFDLGRLATVFSDQGRAQAAARLLASAETMTAQLAIIDPLWAVKRNEATLTAIRAQLDDAAFDEAWEAGKKLTSDEALALALGAD